MTGTIVTVVIYHDAPNVNTYVIFYYIQVKVTNYRIIHTECNNYSKPLPLVAAQSCGIFGPP